MGALSDSDSDEEIVNNSKRRRTCINDHQLRMLMETYQSNRRPSRHMIEKLSRKIGLRSKVVQIWFQNRRAKDKHMVSGTEQVSPGPAVGQTTTFTTGWKLLFFSLLICIIKLNFWYI